MSHPHIRDVQILAANIDTVVIVIVIVIVIAIDLGLNLKALERLVIMAWDSSAAPVVVLTKCDGALDVSIAVPEARAIAPDVPVIAARPLLQRARPPHDDDQKALRPLRWRRPPRPSRHPVLWPPGRGIRRQRGIL